MNKFDIVIFNDDDLSLEVNFDKDHDTVWLTQEQISELFSVDRTRITRHINNIYKAEELSKDNTCAESAHMGKLNFQQYKVKLYNLDMIIAIGYRVNSRRGTLFRKWANEIIKQYLIQGYAVNQKRLAYLEKTINLIDIAARLDKDITSIDGSKILDVIVEYKKALDLLDDYDHQTLIKPMSKKDTYRITYKECREIVNQMKFNSLIFGVEKDASFNSSINVIYQTAFGEDIYPTALEKAANLLYFIIKNHSFIDGNKPIAAAIFLHFLNKNNLLYKNNEKQLSDSTLVAITILIAESNPNEKDIIIDLIMNILLNE